MFTLHEPRIVLTEERTVYLLLLSGDPESARRMVQSRYPHARQVLLSRRELRESSWKGQVRAFRELRGEALVIFSEALSGLNEPQLLLCSAFLHACSETILADERGELKVYTRSALLRHLPVLFFSGFLDLLVLIGGWVLVRIFCSFTKPQLPLATHTDFDVAYLYPFPFDRAVSGGAVSHVTGFLSGLAENSAACEIFSGRPMRCGRFVVAGALLSWLTSIPLVLEYNGSEFWVTKHWDPARFRGLLRLCEQACIKTASLIVVVSEALRDELLQQGVPQERILVNPNGVDPAAFQPDCGGREMRTELGLTSDNVVVCFVGSFGYWHGIEVLERAITMLMKKSKDCSSNLRFLLVGDGVLQAEIREALQEYVQSGLVVFTGLVPHGAIPRLLD